VSEKKKLLYLFVGIRTFFLIDRFAVQIIVRSHVVMNIESVVMLKILQASWILTNLLSGTTEETEVVVGFGVLPTVSTVIQGLVHAPDQSVQGAAMPDGASPTVVSGC
jgi:hypothetical protein